MAHAVVLFVAACELMLLYHAVHIIVHIGCHHDAVLCAAIHGLRVDIIMVGVVLHEPSVVAERAEILHGFAVNAFVMLVGTCGEVDFRFDYVIERHGIAFGFLACFFRVQYVVGA